jgi:hypothetical protein
MASQPQIRFCLKVKVRFREFRELREFSQGITAVQGNKEGQWLASRKSAFA